MHKVPAQYTVVVRVETDMVGIFAMRGYKLFPPTCVLVHVLACARHFQYCLNVCVGLFATKCTLADGDALNLVLLVFLPQLIPTHVRDLLHESLLQ